MHTTLQDILSRYRTRIDSLDIELIVAHVLDRSREFVLTHPEYVFAGTQLEEITELLNRRTRHEPLAYLLGHREFFGLDFRVTKDTLIPRPETELMVEEIVRSTERKNSVNGTGCIIDVGTGSGAIIIAVANELSKLESENERHIFFGIDISSEAIEVAKGNAKSNHLGEKIFFAKSDLLENISSSILEKKIDTLTIAANLPYLSHAIYESSMPDVKNFEPKSALVSEEDGLHHYRRLLEQVRALHEKKTDMPIELFFEIGPEQRNAIEKLIRTFFPRTNAHTSKDLSGKYRLTRAEIRQ